MKESILATLRLPTFEHRDYAYALNEHVYGLCRVYTNIIRTENARTHTQTFHGSLCVSCAAWKCPHTSTLFSTNVLVWKSISRHLTAFLCSFLNRIQRATVVTERKRYSATPRGLEKTQDTARYSQLTLADPFSSFFNFKFLSLYVQIAQGAQSQNREGCK